MKRFTWMVPALAFAVAMTIAACGDSNQNGNGTPTPTPTYTVTPVPTDGAGSCVATDANTGRKVIYAGVQGNTTFPDANATYVGQIAGPFIGTYLPISFPHLSSAVYIDYTQLLLEATCTPTVVGRSVIYNGAAVTGKFPAPAAPPAYTGTITRAYISWASPYTGWFEVAWAAPLNKTIAVRFSEVYY